MDILKSFSLNHRVKKHARQKPNPWVYFKENSDYAFWAGTGLITSLYRQQLVRWSFTNPQACIWA